MKRKKDQVGRERASELRSEAATTAAAKQEQEARAREAEAEAERVRAQADKLEVRAQEERTSYDMTQARQEDSLREADRVDPDVDHRSTHYTPDLNGSPVHGNDTRTTPGTTRATGWNMGTRRHPRAASDERPGQPGAAWPGDDRARARAGAPRPDLSGNLARISKSANRPRRRALDCSSNPENTSQTGIRSRLRGGSCPETRSGPPTVGVLVVKSPHVRVVGLLLGLIAVLGYFAVYSASATTHIAGMWPVGLASGLLVYVTRPMLLQAAGAVFVLAFLTIALGGYPADGRGRVRREHRHRGPGHPARARTALGRPAPARRRPRHGPLHRRGCARCRDRRRPVHDHLGGHRLRRPLDGRPGDRRPPTWPRS